MNWGIRITLLYLGFVALILTLVFTCMNQSSELESKNYYARELKFQEQLDAAGNAGSLEMPISYALDKRSVRIEIPEELMSNGIKGNVQFIRPSSVSMDRFVELRPDANGKQTIDPGFAKGVYKMQISYHSKGKAYYQEAVLNFE